MKQLLFPLLLFPAFALAQYPGNANQKITLGEQTTADGLIWRGVASIDTVTATSKITRANKQDTSAFLLLDTTTNLLWHYKIGSNAWTQAGGSTFDTTTLNLTTRFSTKVNISDTASMLTPYIERGDTASMLTPYWRSGRFSGTLPVANGGTNATTLTANKVMVGNGTSGVLTPTNLHWDNTNSRLGIGTATPTAKFVVDDATVSADNKLITVQSSHSSQLTKGVLGFTSSVFSLQASNIAENAYQNLALQPNGGKVGIGTASPQSGYRLHVVDSVYVGGNVSASAYTTRSDYDLKDEIQNINYGINEVMQMQPVKYTYKSNGSTQLGFIAQDLGVITPEVVSFEDKMSVYYNALIPILTKAIQEQQALIKALEQRIINLENK